VQTPLASLLCGSIATDPGGQDCGNQNEKSDPHTSGSHVGQISLPTWPTYWPDHIGDFGPPE
jgi:hypothetical protein